MRVVLKQDILIHVANNGSVLDLLRTVPTFVTAHTFCASRDTRVSFGLCLLIKGYFARFKTMRRKQNLASLLESKMKIGGNHAFFRDDKASIYCSLE